MNDRGRLLIEHMNELGVLIDVTHASAQCATQVVEVSRAPVVASHVSLAAVSGSGISDMLLQALAEKGGMVGIIGASASIGKDYRKWLIAHPAERRLAASPVFEMIAYHSALSRPPRDHGEYGAWFDSQMRMRHRAAFSTWNEPTETQDLVPTVEDWAEHVRYVTNTVGAEHIGIGLDLVRGRSCVPTNGRGYLDLIRVVREMASESDAANILGLNWLRALDRAKA